MGWGHVARAKRASGGQKRIQPGSKASGADADYLFMDVTSCQMQWEAFRGLSPEQ